MKSSQSETTLGVSGAVWFEKEDLKFLGADRIRLLEKIDELGSITKAAKAVGICYKTAWDLVNMINNLSDKPLVDRLTGGKGGGGTTLTAEGKNVLMQFRIIQDEHSKFLDTLASRLGDAKGSYQLLRMISMKVSARNIFSGTVAGITKGSVNAEVILTLKGGASIVATVTDGAVDKLELEVGTQAYAIIKASSVIVGTDLHNSRISTRNMMCGTVTKIIEGQVNSEVDVEVGGGNVVSAVITHDSAESLGLAVGGHACVIFKASSVILGVN